MQIISHSPDQGIRAVLEPGEFVMRRLPCPEHQLALKELRFFTKLTFFWLCSVSLIGAILYSLPYYLEYLGGVTVILLVLYNSSRKILRGIFETKNIEFTMSIAQKLSRPFNYEKINKE